MPLFLDALIHTMYSVMNDEHGIGLAANQIGSPFAVFVLNVDGILEHFINPQVVSQWEPVDYEEACLSIPGTSAKTIRFNKLILKYSTYEQNNFIAKECEFEEKRAIAIQHEMDHLDGKLYIDQFKPVKKAMIVDKHKKYLKQKERGHRS